MKMMMMKMMKMMIQLGCLTCIPLTQWLPIRIVLNPNLIENDSHQWIVVFVGLLILLFICYFIIFNTFEHTSILSNAVNWCWFALEHWDVQSIRSVPNLSPNLVMIAFLHWTGFPFFSHYTFYRLIQSLNVQSLHDYYLFCMWGCLRNQIILVNDRSTFSTYLNIVL